MASQRQKKSEIILGAGREKSGLHGHETSASGLLEGEILQVGLHLLAMAAWHTSSGA